nr:SprB repeat-containing protein [Bacteroidota bacterium]
TVNPLPTPSITGALAFCAGGSTTLSAGSFASYLWSTMESSSTISVTTAGTFTVTVTDGNGCTASTSATTTIDVAPTATAGADIAGCVCCSTVFTVTGSIGGSATGASWNSNGGGLFSNGGAWSGTGETYTPAGSDLVGAFPKIITVTLTTNANGTCPSAVSTLTITLNQVPNLVTTPAVMCVGGTRDLSLLVTDANTTTGTLAYYATLLDAQNETNAISAIVSNTTGTFYIRKNTSTTPVCSDIESVVISATTLSLSETHVNVLCNGALTGSIDITTTPGLAPYTYAWSDGAVTTEDRTGIAAGLYTVTVSDANGCTFSLANILVGQPGSAVSALCSGTNVACFGGATGSASVLASGGTGTLTYVWSNSNTNTGTSISGLIAGIYTVTVTDANLCTATCSYTVTQPASALTATCSGTNVACFGASTGSASVVAANGTSGYTYVWSNSNTNTGTSITGLAAGTYTVTVTDANGCTATCSYTVTQPATAVTATCSGTNVACFGASTGSASVVAADGTSGYTYVWSNSNTNTGTSITGLAAGTHTVSVTDAMVCCNMQLHSNACNSSTPAGNVACFGASTGSASVVAADGTSGYTYVWSNSNTNTGTSITGLMAGTYTVTVTDANGCTTCVMVTQPAALQQPAAANVALVLAQVRQVW